MTNQSHLRRLAYKVFWDIAQHPGTYHRDIFNRLRLKSKLDLAIVLHYLADNERLVTEQYRREGTASVLAFYANPSIALGDVLKKLSDFKV